LGLPDAQRRIAAAQAAIRDIERRWPRKRWTAGIRIEVRSPGCVAGRWHNRTTRGELEPVRKRSLEDSHPDLPWLPAVSMFRSKIAHEVHHEPDRNAACGRTQSGTEFIPFGTE